MSDKINFGLDPAVYLAFVAQLCSGSTNSAELVDHADQLLATIASGDYSIIGRNAAAFILAGQMTAQAMLQRALQADTPEEAGKWMDLARSMQKTTTTGAPQLSRTVPQPPAHLQKAYWDMTPAQQVEADRLHREELVRKGLVRPKLTTVK